MMQRLRPIHDHAQIAQGQRVGEWFDFAGSVSHTCSHREEACGRDSEHIRNKKGEDDSWYQDHYWDHVTTNLNPDRALIFRITHISNVGWIMQNGLHCANSEVKDPRFVQIGNPDLIGRRRDRPVGGPYGGTLSDYVPFYFTPYSPMLLNIVTGYGGITRRSKDEIVILVSSIWKLRESGVEFVISDRHALVAMAEFSADTDALQRIDWDLLRRKDFRRDPDDPGKVERYEAEALARDHVPTEAFIGAYAYNEMCCGQIVEQAERNGWDFKVVINPRVFF